MTECTPGLTKHAAVSPSSSANVELILGVAIGCTVAVAIIVVVIVCCCVTASKRHRQSNVASQAPVGSMAPKHSIQTKRFRKQKTSMTDADRASYGRAGATAGGAATGAAITQADIDRALVNTVERLDPQSKDILASLLRSASAASLDRLGSGSGVGPSNYLYTRSNAFENGTMRQMSLGRRVSERIDTFTRSFRIMTLTTGYRPMTRSERRSHRLSWHAPSNDDNGPHCIRGMPCAVCTMVTRTGQISELRMPQCCDMYVRNSYIKSHPAFSSQMLNGNCKQGLGALRRVS
jgi:hypothetical protein